MFALLPNHCRFRYTYQKLSHNEGDISIRVLPLSVNIFLYIYMGTAYQLLDFCSTKLRYSRWLRNCIIVYWYIIHVIASELIIIMQKCPYNYCRPISHIFFLQNGGLIIWFSHPNYKFAARLLELVFLCCRPNTCSPI